MMFPMFKILMIQFMLNQPVFSPRASVHSHDTQIEFFPDVPVNLLGTDLLADLQIAVVPVRDGLLA